MIPRSPILAAVLAAAAALPAQEPGADPTPVGFETLNAEYRQAQADSVAKRRAVAATEEYRKAREARDMATIEALMAPAAIDMASFVARFQAGAAVRKGTEDAIPFLTWLANQSGDPTAIEAAVDTLLADHAESAALIEVAERPYWALRMSSPEAGLDRLAALGEASPHAEVKGWAFYNLASFTRRQHRDDAAAAARADAFMARAEELAPDGSLLRLRLDAPRFQRERLQLGMEVPDIVGEDLDGVPFKLSDYRGKVVVLDFWGDW